jgi:Fe-S-cluster containining protein
MSLHSDRMLCKECGGTCCKCINVSFKANPTSDFVGFMEVRGVEKIEVEGGFLFLDNNKCPHFDNDGDCGIQETKPKYCKDFPFNLPPHGLEKLVSICPLLKSRIKEK